MRVVALSFLLLLAPLSAEADCSGGSSPTGLPCGAIDTVGCCKSGTLYFCEGGEVCALDCTKIPQCGWNADKGFYDCETTGGADPDLDHPLECPSTTSAECQGVDYSGCCAGSWVYWCDGKQLQGFDCSANQDHNTCGTNAAAAVADCVQTGSAEYKSCPFEPGGVEVPEPREGDVVSGDSGGIFVDVALSIDGLSVPDIEAPSTCTSLAPRYEGLQNDCEMLGAVFLVKQEGCAALLVGMAPDSGGHPGAKVTKTGLAFSFAQGGLAYNCTGSFAGDGLSGLCFWGNGGECTFGYAAVAQEVPLPEPPKSSGGGGCAATDRTAVGPVLTLLLLLGWSLMGVRLGRRQGG